MNTNVVDTSVVEHGDGLSSIEELESLGLIKMLKPIGDTKEKSDDQTFRLLTITKKGFEELHPNQQKIKQ